MITAPDCSQPSASRARPGEQRPREGPRRRRRRRSARAKGEETDAVRDCVDRPIRPSNAEKAAAKDAESFGPEKPPGHCGTLADLAPYFHRTCGLRRDANPRVKDSEEET